MCQAINEKKCATDLSIRNPGLMSHSRWLTTANRILWLYVANDHSTEELSHLITYVITVYAPVWFFIKSNPSYKDGARYFFQSVSKSRYLTEDLKNTVDPVIQRNSFFAHPVNLLISMITNNRKHIRELGIRRILKARQQSPSPSTEQAVRQIRLPRINFACEEYTELINWANENVTEPPLTFNLSNQSLTEYVKEANTPVIELDNYPCHTQAVERCLKLVSEASEKVCGLTKRDGFIRARLSSIETLESMSKFETKNQYN